MKRFAALLLVGVVVFLATLPLINQALACGGLFCQNIPVDQQAERIIFTVNDNNTVSAYIQINYTGSAPDFSWVVPVPSVPEVDVAEIATFDAMSAITAPVFIPPQMPECAPLLQFDSAVTSAGGGGQVLDGVSVLASGTAGPYAYDVVTSPDPNELITWLRTNQYQITEPMEPLIKVYTDEGMVFLAMKLQPEQGVQDIQPIVMTYEGNKPFIPIRLTAVAATPNMSVLTWVFADAQAYPVNYAHPKIDAADLRNDFFQFGGNNYLALVDQIVDLYAGRAFITEYAQPTSELMDFAPTDPLVLDFIDQYAYVTRLFGRISPEEMIVDPQFDVNPDLADVSNVWDLSKVDAETYWGCADTPLPEVEFDSSVVPEGFE
jgi:hypothetical protein